MKKVLDIPVVFTHRNNRQVETAMRQAQQYNQRVILLGDESNRNSTVEHHAFRKHAKDAKRFAKVYQHMHTRRDEEYEEFCYLRWFYISDFMRKHHIPRIFAGDSDLMLYRNVTEIANDWNGYTTLLCIPSRQRNYRWSATGHASYWSSRDLEDFCDFLLWSYTTDEGLLPLCTKWRCHQSTRRVGGICDMTLLYLFWLQRFESIGNLLSVTGTPPHAFDLNFNTSENHYPDEYQMEATSETSSGSILRVAWKDQQPYGYNQRLGCQVRLDGIHFQGAATRLISQYRREAPK